MQSQTIFLRKWKIKKKQYTGNPKVILGAYNLKALSSYRLSEAHIRTLSNFIRKFYKKKAFAFYKIHYNKQITTKSLGMRMGKGKGSKKKSIYYVGIGNIFLEIGESKTRTQNDFKIFYQMLKKKLPMNIQLISLSNTNSFLRL